MARVGALSTEYRCPICGKPIRDHDDWNLAPAYGYVAGFICPEAPEGTPGIVVLQSETDALLGQFTPESRYEQGRTADPPDGG